MCVQQSAQRGLFGVFPSTHSPESQQNQRLGGKGWPPAARERQRQELACGQQSERWGGG